MNWSRVAQPDDGDEPSFSAAFSSALQDQLGQQKSLGARGMVESVAPLTLFSVTYPLTGDLRLSVLLAVAVSAAFVIWRVVRGGGVGQALTGLAGVGLGAAAALLTGRSENFFLPTMLKNLGFALGYAISALVGWPLVGVLLGFLLGEGTAWREVPRRRRVYTIVTWLWVAMFGLRLAVQTGLYLTGHTTALGLAGVVLGVPLFALVLLLTWRIVRTVPTVEVTPPDPQPIPAGSEPAGGTPAPDPG